MKRKQSEVNPFIHHVIHEIVEKQKEVYDVMKQKKPYNEKRFVARLKQLK